jgi:hypothetical protein
MNNEFLPIPNGTCHINEFYHSFMWLDNGVLFGKYKPNLVIDLTVAKDLIRDRKTVSGNIARPFFIDITELLSVDKAARNYMASAGACEFMNAGAIYTQNKLLAFIGNAFILLDRPPIPIKVFSNEKHAMIWLEPYKYPN